MRQIDRLWDHVHVAIVSINAVMLAPCFEPLGDATSAFDSEIQRHTLSDTMSPPGDACRDVSRPIDSDAGLIRSAGADESGHSADVKYILNQRLSLRQKLNFAPSNGDEALSGHRNCH